MEYQEIELVKDGPVGLLYLNRPEALNALSQRMRSELIRVLQETEADDQIRVMILTGRGRGFCAGADLDRFIQAQGKRAKKGETGFGYPDLPRAFTQYPKPMIAAINGIAYGFGFTVTLTCDIRLASEKARFSCAFTRIGLTPEFCSTYFLPRLIGYSRAAELIFTARSFDAYEALQMGVVSRVIPPGQLLREAKRMAKQIASMPAFAIRASKEALRHGMDSSLDQTIQHELAVFSNCMQMEEHRFALNQLLEQMKFRKSRCRGKNDECS